MPTDSTTNPADLLKRYNVQGGVVNVEKGPTLFNNAQDQARFNQEENVTRDQYRAQAQGTVDAIKESYAPVIDEYTKAKQDMASRAYLSSLAGGRAASPTGATEVANASETGQKKVNNVIAERDAKIAAAYANADARASQAFLQKKQDYLSSQKDQKAAAEALNTKVKNEAENEIAAYASTMSYDQWKNKVGPQKLQQYMQETGQDETGLQALFLKNHKNDLVDQNGTKLADGSISFLKREYDANGNLTGVREVARIQGKKAVKSAQVTDNGIQINYKDGTYEVLGENGNVVDNGKPVAGAPTGFTTSDIKKGADLFQKYGQNGYAEPALYVDAYQNWINTGGKASKFLELYPPEQFVDPAHKELLPTYLQPKTKAAVAGPTLPAGAGSGTRQY